MGLTMAGAATPGFSEATDLRLTLETYQNQKGRHRLQDVVSYWRQIRPDAPALIENSSGRVLTWRDFDEITTAYGLVLLHLGLQRGDFFVTALPFLSEHVLLEYACFKIGVIHTPLDMRLKAPEIVRSIRDIGARGFACLGKTAAVDSGELARAVLAECPTVSRVLQFTEPEDTVPGALSAPLLIALAHALAQDVARGSAPELAAAYAAAASDIQPTDGAQVIFTTGSTGYPKPALLSHQNITCQNLCLSSALRLRPEDRLLVNLPPSHVGGQAIQLMSTLFAGATAVLVPVFHAESCLEAIQKHGITVVAQVPAMYALELREPRWSNYDLSTLRYALVGGQAASRPILEKLYEFAPFAGSGLALTEAAGFCSYTPFGAAVEELATTIGSAQPLYRITIREPMRPDGSAGPEVMPGVVGQICGEGPQTFLGYVNHPEATAAAISSDGVLYTGDMGSQDGRKLKFAGRARWVIKPNGYQVFPGQVEDHFVALAAQVANCGVVGVPDEVSSEAIVAFIELRDGASLTEQELREHALGMASYMRPARYVILPSGSWPLNRNGKTDYLRLAEMLGEE
jgi:fatty-acyl-CoA synthase